MTPDLLAAAERPVLLVQPHPDDVCYSIGGLVALAAPLVGVTLVTVFSRSAWALSPALRREGVARISATRREEDERFCARHGLGFEALDFPDSSAIGHDERSEMSADPEGDARTPAVAAALRDVIRRLAPATVIGPAALGGHVDHRIVRDALAGLAAPGRALFFYEDLPYAARLRPDALARGLAARGLRPSPPTGIDAVIDAKVAAMRDYRSQTDDETVDAVRLHARRVGGDVHAERLWA